MVKHLQLDLPRVNCQPISRYYTISCNRNSSLQLTHIACKHLNEGKSTTRTSRLRTSVKWAFRHVEPRHLLTFRTSINGPTPTELCQVLGLTMASLLCYRMPMHTNCRLLLPAVISRRNYAAPTLIRIVLKHKFNCHSQTIVKALGQSQLYR